MATLIRDFPNELVIVLGGFLEPRDLLSLILTCHRYHNLLRSRLVELASWDEYAFTVLFWSILSGNEEQAKLVLSKSKRINVVGGVFAGYIHIYPSHRVFDLGKWDWVKGQGVQLFLEDTWSLGEGYDRYYTPFQWAIKTHHHGLLRLILAKFERKGVKILSAAIYLCVKEENLKGLEILLTYLETRFGERAWRIGHRRAVEAAVGHRKESVVKFLLPDGVGLGRRSSLKRGAPYLSTPSESLIPAGSLGGGGEKDRYRWSPLHDICKQSKRSAAELLMMYGAGMCERPI